MDEWCVAHAESGMVLVSKARALADLPVYENLSGGCKRDVKSKTEKVPRPLKRGAREVLELRGRHPEDMAV